MSKTSNFIVGFVAGATIGAALGVLFAPEEGKETRKKIKKSFDDISEDLKNKLDDFDLKEKTQKIKASVEDNIENFLSNSSYKAEEVIEVLERKLQQLKQANAKLQK